MIWYKIFQINPKSSIHSCLIFSKNDGYEIQNKIEKKTDNKIFEFGLKYFFNVVLRIAIKQKGRDYLPMFIEIIKVYIENDVNKAKFILEEFSNAEIINEYLVYCPTKSGTMASDEIINFSFKKLYEEVLLSKNKNDDDINFIFKFINTYVLFISYNINTISIENVNATFYKILRITSSQIFINYLKEKLKNGCCHFSMMTTMKTMMKKCI